MAFEIPNYYVGVFPSSQDLSGISPGVNGQFKAVKMIDNGSGQAALALASTGGQAFGILQNKPALNEAGTVMCEGISKVLLGGTVVVNDFLMSDATGQLIKATSTNYIVAQACEGGASGEYIGAYLKPAATKAP